MRSLLFVILSFGVTVLAWGIYGPVLHWGQAAMVADDAPIKYARLRPFVCVGLAYFLIGVIVPAVLLRLRGEQGHWTMTGMVQSLVAGALGAVGALGIIMAFTFGGKPTYVMPLVFGGAPVVNAFITIYWAKRLNEVGPVFLAGLVMVLLGAVTVLSFAPAGAKPGPPKPAAAEAPNPDTIAGEVAQELEEAGKTWRRFGMQLLSIATVIVCWGAYGPTLHKGQAAMQNSRLRPLLCVGLAYFAIAVVVPMMLLAGPMPEPSSFAKVGGAFWSLLAGAAGAIGALGIILAFNFGGKPIYVMPLVFGGAPVVTTLVQATGSDAFSQVGPLPLAVFLAGLMLTIAGAAIVLVFAPRGAPPKKKQAEPDKPAEPEPPKEAEAVEAAGPPSEDAEKIQ